MSIVVMNVNRGTSVLPGGRNNGYCIATFLINKIIINGKKKGVGAFYEK